MESGGGSPRRSTVVLADDHGVLRAGMRALLAGEEEFEVVGEAADGASLMELVRTRHPDVAVVDLHMPGGSVETISNIRDVSPDTHVVVLTMNDDAVIAARALRLGAVAYVLKEAAPFVLMEAMRTALAGGVYLQPELGAKLARQPSGDPLQVLSEREREVLAGIARGETNREIAKRLFLSVRTVETHRARLQAKLGIAGVIPLTDLARRYGLVEAETQASQIS